MLKIYEQPHAFHSGPALDTLGAKTESELNSNGIPCRIQPIWSEFWTRHLFNSRLPGSGWMFHLGPARWSCWRHLGEIQPSDVVWVHDASLPISDTRCAFENSLINKGAAYILHRQDDFLSVPYEKEVMKARIPLADLIVVPTPTLRERFLSFSPDVKVEVLEEPVDVERLTPKKLDQAPEKPIVVFTARHVEYVVSVAGILEQVYREEPFILRLVGGRRKPELNFPIPWEWYPHDHENQALHFAGAAAGLAPLEDTPYTQCKGNYKVKTYLASGIPPIAPPIGYNNILVRDGQTGFLASTEQEWTGRLLLLLRDKELACKMGARAREDAVARYSHRALMPVWARILKKHFPQLTESG